MDEPTAAPPSRSLLLRLTVAALALALLAFLAGRIPLDRKLRTLETEKAGTELELRLATIHRHLGLATIHARAGDYATAGVAAIRFFEGCRELAASGRLTDRPRTLNALSAYTGTRDDVLEQIAAADAAVADRLASLYLTFDGVIERRE